MTLDTMVDDDQKVKNPMRSHPKIAPVAQFWWCHQKRQRKLYFTKFK